MRKLIALCSVLCLSAGCSGCLSANDAVSEAQTAVVRAGHALEAVRAAYVAVCGSSDDDAGPTPSKSDACLKAKAAFNAAQSKYAEVNSSL